MSYGFRTMLDAISQKGEERSASSELNNPPDIEEEHRKYTYPDTCSPECEHVTCGYRTEENRGRPCFMKWQQYETLSQSMPPAIRPTSYAKDRSLTERIEKNVEEILRPITQRIEKLENEDKNSVTRSFNVKHKRYPESLRGDSIHG